jgi:hypothetical protein
LNDLRSLFAPDDARDAMRALGGLLLGLGLFMTFIRKSTDLGENWGDWGLLVTLLIAFAFLYGVGMLGALMTGGPRPWESVYLVIGVLLAPFVLLQFIEAINGSPGASLNTFWVFAVTAGLAAVATLVAGLRYGFLLASLAVIVSWSSLWDKILSDGLGAHFGIYRGLLIILAALLLAAAFAVWRLDEREGLWRASDIVTGASVSAVLAGSLSFPNVFLTSPFLTIPGASSSLLWEIVLLVVSLLAVGYGAWFAVRGPAYVGAIGLIAFLILAGSDLNDATPQGKIVGWPLILVIIGAVAFAVSLLPGIRTPDVDLEGRLRGSTPGGPAGGPPGAPSPPSAPGAPGGDPVA